jgi:hypothetical protein
LARYCPRGVRRREQSIGPSHARRLTTSAHVPANRTVYWLLSEHFEQEQKL